MEPQQFGEESLEKKFGVPKYSQEALCVSKQSDSEPSWLSGKSGGNSIEDSSTADGLS